MNETLVLKGDAARMLGCSPANVTLLAKGGALPVAARTPGGVRLFRVEDVERLRAERAARRGGDAA